MFAGTGLLVGGSGLAAGLLNGWPGTRSQPLVCDPLLPHPHGTSPSVRCHLRRGRTGKMTPHALPRAPTLLAFSLTHPHAAPLPSTSAAHVAPPLQHSFPPQSPALLAPAVG